MNELYDFAREKKLYIVIKVKARKNRIRRW